MPKLGYRKKNKIRKFKHTAYIICGNVNILIDVEDIDLVKNHTWNIQSNGYARSSDVESKSFLLHRMIMGFPKDLIIDHKNGNIKDNRRSNLRLATYSENLHNTGIRKTNTSGFKGVSFHKYSKKWQATCYRDGKQVYIGTFSTPEKAAQAYDWAVSKEHPEFAVTNKQLKKEKSVTSR